MRSFCLLFALAGCATPPPEPSVVRIAIQAGDALNPDSDGRPSPVEIWLYELKSKSHFEAVSFFELYTHPDNTLDNSVQAHTQLTVTPGERLVFNHPLTPGTHHLAVLVAFHDIEHSRWRALVDTEPGGAVSIKLDAQHIAMTGEHAQVEVGALSRLVAPIWQTFKPSAPPLPFD
ncbi:type VI secretion system lipoprotein TssJ [Paludibacterium purpuratum]|uniref:type VI secretion system lipoprotein TssJ n=1 Tax=Paludibacterium purpuratum TaxID=1144873 RepID=UPI0014150992|nr:type VI secretion system lipoprotein TssJ [Paludibacterium purpuratum]